MRATMTPRAKPSTGSPQASNADGSAASDRQPQPTAPSQGVRNQVLEKLLDELLEDYEGPQVRNPTERNHRF